MFIPIPMRSFLTVLILSTAALSQAQSIYPNVKIFDQQPGAYAPCEPSIAVDPSDPSRLVAGAVLDYVFTSSDSGKTWTNDRLTSRYGVYGDPCVIADEDGNFYYFHLSSPSGEGWSNPDILDRIVGQRSRDGGNTWSKGSSIGFNGAKDQDKEWAVYDPIRKMFWITWTQFDTYGSKDDSCESNILASYSMNGKRWSEPEQLNQTPGNCIDMSETAEGAVPAAGLDGVYSAWSLNGDILVQRFGSSRKHIARYGEPVVAVTGGANWAFDIPGIGRANGMPITACDISEGPHRGTIYINWADQRNGEDDTDIWITKSTDKGQTWSDPVRVNDDPPGKQQFFTWMDIDQTTGHIYIVFYDRRNHEDTATDVYLAISRDGGQTFENQRISDSPFIPSDGVFFGDYNNISAADGVIRPIWTRNDRGTLSIWTALINEKRKNN